MANRDEFDDDGSFFDSILKRRDGQHPGSLRRVLAITAGLSVLGILGAVMWSTMSETAPSPSEAVPIVRADAEVYKVAPSEPGGMAVPNKDSTIFESLKGQSPEQAKVENLFDDAEQPVRKEDVFESASEPPSAATPVAEAEPPQAAKDVASKMPKMPTVSYEDAPAMPPVELAKPEAPVAETQVAPVAAQDVKEEPRPAEQKPEVAVAPKAAAIQPSAGGNFYVQLAAVKSEADARKQWPTYQAKYGELSDLTLRVQKADLGAKGVYYRIQGGPVSEADARKVCTSINARKSGSCVVAKK